ncbi:serine/threonine protein kinase [Iamia sp. SCSIO 61187]|uniref:serine/threonine-protein kinase n=1 Tax=Iamia sp. SCSIO 61187 TaxID=2722752 RepID=UPI001C63415D|nr:serine/threonine-protein kinase [Iamia sp. SCSIO 61187]QYG94635.1 serine/threonine protein kinase [Iamia sp. SCSIO 61187]
METVGPYRLDALVGRGTTGSVWQATRLGALAQVVAVKRARAARGEDDAADRLRREAAILAELDHPHIVRVIDVLDDGDGVAIVMSLARGGSLHDLLVERGRLTAGQAVAVVSRVADALGSAHRQGVLHGDVKPANILFTSDGEPLLGDFGVAQHLLPGLPGLAALDESSRSAVEGTTGYVDPELVGTGVPEPRNDVYGLGVVAYLALAGRLPHAGADSRAVLAAAEAGDHPPLAAVPGVPPALAAVVETALARDPEARPPTAEALAHALRAAVPADEVVLPGTPTTTPADRRAEADLDVPLLDDGADGAEGTGEPGRGDGVGARGTRAFGPRPPRRDEGPDRGHPILTLAAVVVLLAGAVAGGLWVRDRLDEEQAPGDVQVAGGGPPEAVECADLPPLDVPPGSEELTGDLNGDGCPVPVVWDGQVMRFRLDEDDVQPRSYDFRVGGDRSPGQLFLGDWDCDGRDTPALYRPATGVVAYFSAVPGQVGGEVTASPDPTGITDGRATLDPGDGDDCDTVEVTAEA